MSLELQNLVCALSLSEHSMKRILAHMQCQNLKVLNQKLEKSAEQRRQVTQDYVYILQQSLQQDAIAYAISPLICSALNAPTIYVAQVEPWLTQFYSQYFCMDALAHAKIQSMQEMKLSLNVQTNSFSAQEFYLLSLLYAFLDYQTNNIVLLGNMHLTPELKQQLETCYGVSIVEITQTQRVQLTERQAKKLFLKRKDDDVTQISHMIAADLSPLVAHLCHLSRGDAERLIDDLLYGEHVFEKVSVLAEFTDTIYTYQQKNALNNKSRIRDAVLMV